MPGVPPLGEATRLWQALPGLTQYIQQPPRFSESIEEDRTKKLVSIIVVVAAATALLTGAALAAQNDRPWIGNDGAVDTAKMPDAQQVVDSTGTVVGVVRTEDVFGDDEVYPHPVYSLDDHNLQVGWLGQHGYWAIGQQKAWCTDCVSRVESIGAERRTAPSR